MQRSKCVIRAAAVTLAALLMLNVVQAQDKVPTVIGLSESIVYLDDSSVANEHSGPVFIGQKKELINVLYDTMSDWSAITDDYEVANSKSSDPWVYQEDGETIYNDLDLGTMTFSGPMYNETMCLIKHRNGDTRLCVKHYPFISASADQGYYSYEGVLGLSHGEMNFMRFMKEGHVLQDNVVALDYDSHKNVDSNIRFGSFDQRKAKDGKLYMLPSVGHSKWVLQLESLQLNDVKMTQENDGKIAQPVAFIDSGNTTIQLPMSVYRRVYDEMKQLESGHIRFRESRDYATGGSMKEIKVTADCDEIIDKLPTLKINFVGGVSVEIEPHGYVFPPVPGDYYCKIGIAGVSGSKQYRLGTQFLKNFYTVLDFDSKNILLGAKGTHSTISGDEDLLWQPPKPEPLPEPTQPDSDKKNETGEGDKPSDTDDEKPDQQTEKPDDDKPVDDKPVDDKPIDDKPTDDKPVDDKPADDKPADAKPADDKPADDKPVTKPDEKPVTKPDEKPAPKPDDKPVVIPPVAPKPTPAKQNNAPAKPTKPKGPLNKYLLDPINAMLHLLQSDINALIKLILSPLEFIKKLI